MTNKTSSIQRLNGTMSKFSEFMECASSKQGLRLIQITSELAVINEKLELYSQALEQSLDGVRTPYKEINELNEILDTLKVYRRYRRKILVLVTVPYWVTLMC